MDAVNWFEIPASDFERAAKFYDSIFNVELRREIFTGMSNAVFPASEGVGGAVVYSPHYQPGANGTVIYLNTHGRLDDVLSRIEAAGGQIILPKTSIAPQGDIALMIDTEGNKVGLHQEPTE